jgi:hypothetical protein
LAFPFNSTIINFKDSQYSFGKPSPSSSQLSQTQVDSETDVEYNKIRTINAIFCRKTYIAKPSPASPTIIHYTSETITLIEDNVDNIEGTNTLN